MLNMNANDFSLIDCANKELINTLSVMVILQRS